MVGALSSREYQDFITNKKSVKPEGAADQEPDIAVKEKDALDEGEMMWQTELDTFKEEKSRVFRVLS